MLRVTAACGASLPRLVTPARRHPTHPCAPTHSGRPGFGALCIGFVPHKLAYAALLADYGRLQDASRYCAAVQSTLGALPKLPAGLLLAAAQAKDLAARLEAHTQVKIQKRTTHPTSQAPP